MNVTLINKSDYVVHGWSGGTTAEIFCYPPETSWERKDFEIRISSADCRLDGAPYSDFSGYTRHITPLKGRMHMVHRDHHDVQLETYDVDIFDGSWHTHHTGIAVDFNLLHTDRWNGCMKPLKRTDTLTLPPKTIAGFYTVVDTTIAIEDQTYFVAEGNLLLIETEKEHPIIQISAKTEVICVVAVMATQKETQE